ncbi:MAG: amino acid racemase [bacterium]|nr:amino acid racemase [bacterium]
MEHSLCKHFRIGILGGMGPESGVLLQQLIIEHTPAQIDQDHIEVITYTNPHIPDRTASLTIDDGESYLKAIAESLLLLEKTGIDILVISCITAHARFEEIQNSLNTPLLNIVELAKQHIIVSDGKVGILATDGTINSQLFMLPDQPEKTVIPEPKFQRIVMEVIYDIKKGIKDRSIIDRLEKIVIHLRQAGCVKILLGCTELSIVHTELRNRLGHIFIDPLRLAAQALVQLARK